MDDDIFFITDAISIMSKLKEPPLFNNQEHSLSKIIREQALNYEEEYLHINQKNHNVKKQEMRTAKKVDKGKGVHGSNTNPQFREENRQQNNFKKQLNLDLNRQKIQKSKKQPTDEHPNIVSNNARGKLLIFRDEDQQLKTQNNSKKQKRVEKVILSQQKTKKIEFQDTERYKINPKREQVTKIKHIQDNYKQKGINLDIQSKDNSEELMNSRDVSIISNKILSNYNLLNLQVKQQINMIKYQYLQMEKIDVRKLITKLETQIRRSKIGFRGLSDSLGKTSSVLSLSKREEETKAKVGKKKGQIHLNKVDQKIGKLKDYGLVQMCNQNDQILNEKLAKLQQTCRIQKIKENKYINRIQELQKKYNIIMANIQLKDNNTDKISHHLNIQSNTKRLSIIKQKIDFLKNQIKQTKIIFNNKIKRLKNENAILTNENTYMSQKIQVLNEKKTQTKPKNTNINLMNFDQVEIKVNNKKYSNHNKDSNPGSINDVKSMQSISSARSMNSLSSKPQMGSLNSYKSAKVQYTQKKKSIDTYTPVKNKLKIISPHHLSPPSLGELKQNSFLKRFNGDENRGGFNLHKKSASLQGAIKELQAKYSKHLQQQNYPIDEYYH